MTAITIITRIRTVFPKGLSNWILLDTTVQLVRPGDVLNVYPYCADCARLIRDDDRLLETTTGSRKVQVFLEGVRPRSVIFIRRFGRSNMH